MNDEFFYIKDSQVKHLHKSRFSDDELNYLYNRIPDAESWKEILWRMRNKIFTRPVCKYCGGYVKFNECKRKYNEHCSRQCVHNDENVKNKKKQTTLKNWGCEYTLQSKNIRNKIKKTCLEKYGTQIASQSEIVKEKIRNTNWEKYGAYNVFASDYGKQKILESIEEQYGYAYINVSQIPEIREKISYTCLQKYGYKNPVQSEIVKEKIRNTNWEKYGTYCTLLTPNTKELSKITNFNKYGTYIASQSEIIRNKISYSLSSEDAQLKRRNTCYAKYGTYYYTSTQEWRDKFAYTCLNKYGYTNPMQNPVIFEKQRKNQIKSSNFRSSIEEDKLFELLKTKFNKIIRQYKSELYPYYCDFYIPEIDTYIEYQGYYTHGNHPFNINDNDDLNLVNKWKTQNNIIAINNWTKLDVEKRNKAKENNLNYIEWFSYKEAEQWILNFSNNLLN